MEFSQHKLESFCCQNMNCSDFMKRDTGNLRFSGWSGSGKEIRMVLCKTCGVRFSERKGTVLWESRLPAEQAISLLDHIKEGCGTRATSRLIKVSKDTVTRYIRVSGAHAEKVHDELVSFSPSDKRSPT
jgi:transposase-like protein